MEQSAPFSFLLLKTQREDAHGRPGLQAQTRTCVAKRTLIVYRPAAGGTYLTVNVSLAFWIMSKSTSSSSSLNTRASHLMPTLTSPETEQFISTSLQETARPEQSLPAQGNVPPKATGWLPVRSPRKDSSKREACEIDKDIDHLRDRELVIW